jgi:hypothetical protein
MVNKKDENMFFSKGERKCAKEVTIKIAKEKGDA